MEHDKQHSHHFEWLERPVFRDDQRLTPERLNRIYENLSGRLRHTTLGIAGPGVVYGFKLREDAEGKCEVRDGCIYLTCGLAFDCFGRQLYWPGGWVCIKDLCGEPPECPGNYTLWAHYAERPSTGDDRCGCDDYVADWPREGVRFTVTRDCERVNCDCPEHCGECVTLCEYICGRLNSHDGHIAEDKTLHKICHDPGKLCNVGCDDWLYDHGAGLALACVTIVDLTRDRKDCEPRYGFDADRAKVCGARRHVYRNPLLFELIRGCHLDHARVRDVSFRRWLPRRGVGQIDFAEFADEMRSGVKVWFTEPIAIDTLHPASVFLTAIIQERDSKFLDVLRFPIAQDKPGVKGIEYLDKVDDDHAMGIHYMFDEEWIDGQFVRSTSRFQCDIPSLIELTVRGAMLRDRCGCMLDARPFDIPDDKPGSAMPGDDFVVAFRVRPKGHEDRRKDYEASTEGYTNQRL
jgi:hypothetical protein